MAASGAAPASPVGDEAAGLVGFLNASPTPFHAVAESVACLRAAGFQELSERQPWAVAPGGRYYFTRNASTLVAFAVGGRAAPGAGFVVVGAHTDSPCLKLKPVTKAAPKARGRVRAWPRGIARGGRAQRPPRHDAASALTTTNNRPSPQAGYLSLGVEPYGGGLWYTWLDRDLTLAGRALVRREGVLSHELVNLRRAVLRIPSLAIHLHREVATDGLRLNAQQHLPPVLATAVKAALESSAAAAPAAPAAPQPDAVPAPAPPAGSPPERHPALLLRLLAAELGCAPEDVADFELQLCDTQPAAVGGALHEFVFSGRLDNLSSCYTSLRAFLEACPDEAALAQETGVRMVAHFDHEEVGSASAHGAGSPCMLDAIRRVAAALARGQEGAVERALRASFLVSADMAHAVHPNYSDRHDAAHAPQMHHGLVVKHNANQRYATDTVTAFLFRELGRAAGVPFQEFVVRSDLACGSTIGPIIAANTGMRAVDVGAPMLSMHSVREMCGCDDVGYAVAHLRAVFERFTALDAQLTVDAPGPELRRLRLD
jgi:aspartyl aminopeptidase